MRFRNALWEIVRFEAVWKLAVLCLFHPLFRGLFQTYVSASGLSFNGGILWSFLDLKGALLFLLLFLGTALLIFYEYSTAVTLTVLCRRGESAPLRQVMQGSLWNLGVMKGWSLAAGSLYYVLLLPLVGVGYVNSMVPRISIPWFIFDEMIKTAPGTAGVLAVYLGCFGLWLALLFVPLCMILRRRTFFQAARESLRCWRALGWRRGLLTLAVSGAMLQINSELARYWRRNLLDNGDFDSRFLQYLLYSEAFRKDLIWWLLLTALSVLFLVCFLWVLVGGLERSGPAGVSLPPPWGPDAQALLSILERRLSRWGQAWKRRFQTWRWRAAAGAACLALTAGLLLSLSQPLLVHHPLAIGHRGSSYAVENTLSAVLDARDRGMDCAEIDVQLTADGVPVLFHDGNLLRLADRWESVGDLTWEQLRDIPLRDGQLDLTAPPACLEEVLCALQDSSMGLLIELKPSGGNGTALANAVVDLVERYRFGRRAMFMSLDYPSLLPIMERRPDWWVGCCAYSAAGDIDDAVWRYQVDFLAVEESLVTNRLASQARELNLPLYVWSVYDREKMQQYLEMGVTGLISDYPDILRGAVDAYEAGHTETEYLWEGEGFPIKQ